MTYIIVEGCKEGIFCDYCYYRPAHVLNGFGEFLCGECAEDKCNY